MNKDTVVGILGAVILVAAMVGIFWYEGTQVPGGVGGNGGGGPLQFTWNESTAAGPSAQSSGVQNEGTSENGDLAIDRANLTRVVFSLTWTDDTANSGPDQFRLTVTSPDGTPLSAEGSSSPLTVSFSPLAMVPTQASGNAADLTRLAATNGTGQWTFQVDMVDAGDVGPTPLPIPVPGVQDPGNAWALSTELHYYEAQVTGG